MKLYLPSGKDCTNIFIGLVLLAGILILGMCIRVNDACHGKLGDWLNRLTDWPIEKEGKREFKEEKT